jgi:recombination protein RecA
LASFDQLFKEFKSDFGEKIGGKGEAFPDGARLPFGWFNLDLAIGGGIPMGKITELYAKESSCKTTGALRLVRSMQKLYPKKKNVWVAIEPFDKGWAAKVGVDVDSLYMVYPDYGEAIVDICEGLIGSPECGLMVLDSVAAMVSTRELEQSGEKNDVGGSGLLMKKLINKINLAQARALKDGLTPTVLAINQTRNKIGVVYGNPESTPGGEVKNFAYALRLRFYGKDVKDEKVHPDLAVTKEVNFKVIKHKCGIVANVGDMNIVVVPHKKLKIGECYDFPIVKQYMLKHGVLEQGKSVWLLHVEDKPLEFKNLRGVKDWLDENVEQATQIKQAIIDAEVELAVKDQSETEGFDPETGEVEQEEPKKGKKK